VSKTFSDTHVKDTKSYETLTPFPCCKPHLILENVLGVYDGGGAERKKLAFSATGILFSSPIAVKGLP
jgi:hypothetical protein